MTNAIKVAIIGLDTSHSIEFARRMQAQDCPPDQRVEGMQAVSCLRFDTPFQDKKGLDERQKQLEAWGIPVTEDFSEAVSKGDAVLLEINDAAYHLDYFTRCVKIGKPIFLDKPLADTIANGNKIYSLAKQNNARVCSASSLRFVPQLQQACEAIPEPLFGSMYGPLGVAAAGSSIVWYGVHAFEMLERAMGAGASEITTKSDKHGVVALVDYADGRRGIVELTVGGYIYGGCVRTKEEAQPFVVDMIHGYRNLLTKIRDFFAGGDIPVSMESTQHIMAMLDAAETSFQTGKPEKVAACP